MWSSRKSDHELMSQKTFVLEDAARENVCVFEKRKTKKSPGYNWVNSRVCPTVCDMWESPHKCVSVVLTLSSRRCAFSPGRRRRPAVAFRTTGVAFHMAGWTLAFATSSSSTIPDVHWTDGNMDKEAVASSSAHHVCFIRTPTVTSVLFSILNVVWGRLRGNLIQVFSPLDCCVQIKHKANFFKHGGYLQSQCKETRGRTLLWRPRVQQQHLPDVFPRRRMNFLWLSVWSENIRFTHTFVF